MPVSSICLDLSALRGIDEAGNRGLAALCRVLRLDGLQVEVRGLQAEIHLMLLQLGLTQVVFGARRPARADHAGR